MKEIELLKIIFKDSPDILEPLNKIDKEIERLHSIIKEVREYIYNNSFDEERKEIIDELLVNEIKDILEILDKGEVMYKVVVKDINGEKHYEVEDVQEDKKIEKIDEILTIMCDDLKDKIKEIVDKINKE